jgi:hypothetical protein
VYTFAASFLILLSTTPKLRRPQVIATVILGGSLLKSSATLGYAHIYSFLEALAFSRCQNRTLELAGRYRGGGTYLGGVSSLQWHLPQHLRRDNVMNRPPFLTSALPLHSLPVRLFNHTVLSLLSLQQPHRVTTLDTMEDVHPSTHTPETTDEEGSPTSPPAADKTKDTHPATHMRETTDDIANMEAGGTSTFPQAVDGPQDDNSNEPTAEGGHAVQDTTSTPSEPTAKVAQATHDISSMEDIHRSLLAAVRDLHTQLKSSPNEVTPEAVLASHSIASKMVNALIENNAAHARLASGSVSGSVSDSDSVSETSTWQSVCCLSENMEALLTQTAVQESQMERVVQAQVRR